MLFRIILLLAIAGGLAVFTLSNLQPIALVFLGIQTPALPLSWWVLGAIGAGALTTVAISILISLSNYATGRKVRSRFRQATQGQRFQGFSRSPFQGSGASASTAPRGRQASSATDDDSAWKNWDGYEDKTTVPQSATRENLVEDDWDTGIEDDWENSVSGRTTAKTPEDRFQADSTRKQKTDEATPNPQSGSRSGSVYSYSYKDPKSSGAGRREAVVDAEYRVIVPPYRMPENEPLSQPTSPSVEENVEENADDWFEDEDGGNKDRA